MMFQWLNSLMQTLPERVTRVLGGDLNDKLGLSQGILVDDSCIGTCNPGHQNSAAEFLHEMMQAYNLCAVNTFYETAETFDGQDFRPWPTFSFRFVLFRLSVL